MAITTHDKKFLGVGWSFPPEFSKFAGTVQTKMVAEEEDIRESLTVLLSTRPGERVMQPDFGCRLHTKVHEVLSESTITEIRDLIERAVLFFETRITLNSIDVDDENAAEGKLLLQLNYTIRKTNTRSNVVYPFYFIEGTHVQA